MTPSESLGMLVFMLPAAVVLTVVILIVRAIFFPPSIGEATRAAKRQLREEAAHEARAAAVLAKLEG